MSPIRGTLVDAHWQPGFDPFAQKAFKFLGNSEMDIVLQDSFLFPMSMKENIRFGRPDASDEEVVEAARNVGDK